MEANRRGAVAGDYVVANSSAAVAQSTACVDAACAAQALATFDLAQWQNAIAAALPQSSWTVAQSVAGNPTTYTITISWVDRLSDNDTTIAAFDNTSQVGANNGSTGERFFYTATRTVFDPL